MSKRIGILTAGSDCSGLNAAIRAIGKAWLGSYGQEIVGFHDGFTGLVEDRWAPVESAHLSGIITAGGTILGTSRDLLSDEDPPASTTSRIEAAVETYRRHKLDALICIGGRETQDSAFRLAQRGLNMITLPKAIDNDMPGTEQAIGFQTALETGAESIDRLHSTAHSTHRIILVELMGRSAGWLALGAGMAGGADIILIPEIPYDIEKVSAAILRRSQAGKDFSIIAVAERIVSKEQVAFRERLRLVSARSRGEADLARVDAELEKIEEQSTGTTLHIANRLKDLTGLDTRMTILGYLLRGGAPSAGDRLLATQLGTAVAKLAAEKRFGVMVGKHAEGIGPIPLEEVAGKRKPIPPEHPWLEAARQVGTCLGD